MDYNVQSNIKKTVFSDIKEITNTNVDWNRFNGKTVLITGAGGFIGYLAQTNDISYENMKRAIIYGSTMASFCVEKFGTERLVSITEDDIEERKTSKISVMPEGVLNEFTVVEVASLLDYLQSLVVP